MRIALLCSLMFACDDTIFPPPHGGATAPEGEGFCAVQALFASSCVSCHSAAGSVGGLDLETDPYSALVAGDLVIPGDPDGSLLIDKLQSGQMPPGGGLAPESVAVVRQWVADGASPDCEDPTAPPGGYHPDGWSDPAVHGIAAKFRDEPCQDCHGEALDGGDVGVSCASCHARATPDWTTTCTFCHGDPAAAAPSEPAIWAAAPPQDIDDNDDPATIRFPPHRLHLTSELHADWGCETCHAVPDSVFSTGHLFAGDATPGLAEVVLAGGTFQAGTCTVSCHGNGRTPGTVAASDQVACGDCHRVDGRGLSEPHDKHVEEGVACAECHSTVDAAGRVVLRDQHVDGAVQVVLPAGMTLGPGPTCAGSCHGEAHLGRQWIDD